MIFSLKNKSVFITGGANGLGLSIAKQFISDEARVIIADVKDGTDIAEEIGATFVYVDVSDENSVKKAMEDAVNIIGKLDIVVNNAGVGDVGPTIEGTEDIMLKKMTSINQYGVFYGLKYAPIYMNDGGSIINTSSLAGLMAVAGNGVYSATKAALLSMTKTSAMELGTRGIRVNAVSPGFINCGMGVGEDEKKLSRAFTFLGRMGTGEEVAYIYHFLASDASTYITGQNFNLDGGWTAGVSPRLFEAVLGGENWTVSAEK